MPHARTRPLDAMPSRRKLRVAFLHPDLGLGGAERLVVDAAVELSSRGHQVDVFTAFHDPKRAFKETVDGPFSVSVRGSWFPRSIFGKAHAFCAYVRCILAALSLAWAAFRRRRQYDVVFADQVSVVTPVLSCLTTSKVLFYCHHPDMLLAHRRPGLHALYRLPLDWLEQETTGLADLILVNSAYTADVFGTTFTRLRRRGLQPAVLHPACEVPPKAGIDEAERTWQSALPGALLKLLDGSPMFLSINRFERKKDIGLAIRALGLVQRQHSRKEATSCKLVVAGGYDKRLSENREYLLELQTLAETEGVAQSVYFLPSFSDAQRSALLAACEALLYTPTNEHFGIVPLEAMAAGRPVVACRSGGPRETVVHGHTGMLCEPTPASFAAAMRLILEKGGKRMGAQARQHVIERFSRSSFGERLEGIVQGMVAKKQAA